MNKEILIQNTQRGVLPWSFVDLALPFDHSVNWSSDERGEHCSLQKQLNLFLL